MLEGAVQPADYFRQIPLFADLDPEEIVDVLRIARVVSFKPGQFLCTHGERGDCAYVIERGEAAVRAPDEAGKPMLIAQVGAGQVVGELALVDGHPRSADVVALSEVRGYRIDRAELDVLRRGMHPAAFKILRRIAITVSDRLRDVNDAIAAELTRPTKAAQAGRVFAGKGVGAGPAAGAGERVSRAAMRASRDLGRVSIPEPSPAPKAAARPTGKNRPAPATSNAPSKAPAKPAPAPSGSVWRSMLDKLSGTPWK